MDLSFNFHFKTNIGTSLKMLMSNQLKESAYTLKGCSTCPNERKYGPNKRVVETMERIIKLPLARNLNTDCGQRGCSGYSQSAVSKIHCK